MMRAPRTGACFSGYKGKDGALHSNGHLGFDEYESDQTLSLDAQQEGGERFSRIGLNDILLRDYTPEEKAARGKIAGQRRLAQPRTRRSGPFALHIRTPVRSRASS